MLRLSIFCMVLALAAAQSGYEYNQPNRPFGSTSSRPGSSGSTFSSTTTPYPIRPQSDDFSGSGGPTTGYPSRPQGYPGSSSQRPGYPGQGPSGPSSGYAGQNGSSGNYPEQSPNSPGGYPGQGSSDSGYSGPSGSYPGSDPSYTGSRGPSRYPGQNQNYAGQTDSSFGTVGFGGSGYYEGGDYSAIPGEPDIDYPIFSYIPETSFNCHSQVYPGYYADVETRCQVFHVCSNNKTYDFLCPNGTVFSQEDFVCVWWNQFECGSAPGLFELNAKLYDYSIKGSADDFPLKNFNDLGSSYPSNRPQGPSNYPGIQRPSTYPGTNGLQGSSTPYSGGPGSYPSSQSPSGSYPSSESASGSYPGTQGTLDDFPGYQGTGSYPSGPQGPPGSSNSGSGYPGSGSGSSYPGSGPSSQSYPSGRPSGSSSSRPSSGSNQRPGSGSQGYPYDRPSGPGFQPGSNRGRPAQIPRREYLPPKN